MEEINNTNIVNPQFETPPIQPIDSKINIFKYLFIICFLILLIVIISFIFILNNKNSKQSLIKQNNYNISDTAPTNIPTSTITPQEIDKKQKPTITDFNDSKLIKLGYQVSDYDINDITKDCNPCTQECTNRPTDEQNKITNFYDLLKQGYITDATSFLKNYIDDKSNPNKISFVATLFPICSAAHSLLGLIPKENGIVVFTTSGNGYPSIPNNAYYFGYITVVNNKIELYEKLIDGYFNDSGDSYKKALNSNDFKTAVNILDSQSNDVAKSMSSGIFSNKNIQQEFNQLINSIK